MEYILDSPHLKGKEKYEKFLKAMREDFRKKDIIVECVYSSGGERCIPDCDMFGNCWVKDELERQSENNPLLYYSLTSN